MAGSLHGLLALAVLVAALCGACDNPLAPESCGSVPEQTIPVGKSASLRVCFNDGDGDRLSLSARSSDKSVVTVVMRGSIVTVTGARAGTTTVTVTAEDPGGLVASVSFAVWVPRVVQLTTGSQPVWSPDGSRVAFVDYGIYGESVSRDIHVIRPGDIATRLTRSEVAPAWYPAWSPDGSRIAFDSHRDGNRDIYVMNADGSGATNLTNSPAHDRFPVWSPDGSRIAFHRGHDLYVVNVDGSGTANLAVNALGHAWSWSPVAWSPDGRTILFNCGRSHVCLVQTSRR